MKSLAVKFRPKTFEDVIEQDAVKVILKQQLESGNIHSAMLFCGPSGDGKTTTARIFANELNHGKGNPIEMDAASHNGVDDVREIGKLAGTKTIDGSDYKVFIIDECHMITAQGWASFLKLIEEPPAKVVFIFCTTDPQKIPATILSRVQRFQFQKVSTKGIADRLTEIVIRENSKDYDDPDLRDIGDIRHDSDAIEYIAKLADGGVRLAIQYLEKCLAYSNALTTENVVKALNVTDYSDYIKLTDLIITNNKSEQIKFLDEIYASGVDFKQFLKQYVQFILDVNKSLILDDLDEAFKYISLPKTNEIETWLTERLQDGNLDLFNRLLSHLIKTDSEVKYSQSVHCDIECAILLFEV